MKKRLYAALMMLTALVTLAGVALSEAMVVRHGSREGRRVAITLDDCYDRQHIAAAIALCQRYGIPITFFPIGNALKFADGPLWQSALNAGCEIGNHTWGHKTLTRLTAREIRFQLLRTQEKLDAMLGYHYPMQVMRPPGGSVNRQVREASGAAGYQYIVKWDVSQTDFGQVKRDVRSGSILLFHGRQKDIRCLEQLIPWLLAEGYECVTVSTLLGLEPVATSTDLYVYGR